MSSSRSCRASRRRWHRGRSPRRGCWRSWSRRRRRPSKVKKSRSPRRSVTAHPTALEAATKALARRDRSAADLTAYLERRGTGAEDAATAVERLRQAGYVDDARYATARAEVLAERGYGDEAVRFELGRNGLGAVE